MKDRARRLIPGYVLAVAMTAGVLLLLQLQLPSGKGLLLFSFAVLAAAWYGGVGPALLATSLGVLAASYFRLEPLGSLAVANRMDIAWIALFVVLSLAIIAISESAHRARRREVGRQRELERQAHELRDRDERLALALETGGLGTWELDIRSRSVNCSARCRTAFGVPSSDRISFDDLMACLHDEDRGGVSAGLERAIGERADFDAEFRVRWPDGEIHWLIARGRASYAEDGTPLRMNGVTLDVTGHRHAEEQVAAARARLQLVADSVPALISYVDAGGHYRLHNRACQKWFGRAPDEINGRHVRDVIGEAAWETIRPHAERALSGQPASFETLVPHQDGGSRWVSVTHTPDVSADGRVRGFVAHVVDITERKGADEERQKFVSLVENCTDFIAMSGLDGRVTYINPAGREMLGIDSAEAVRTTKVRDYVPEDVQALYAAEAIPAVLEKGHWEGEVQVRHTRTGRLIPMYQVAFLIRDPRGETPLCLATVARDITQQKESAQALREADRRKNEFLATLAHELRNPLAPLRNGLELLALARDDAASTESAREMMGRQLQQMVRLIDDLLDVSRITRNRLELRQERVELTAAVQSAVEAVRPSIESAGHELDVRLPREPVWLHADHMRLAQVVSNLLSNAAKYTSRGGHIRIAAQRTDDELVIEVTDTGIGIRPEHLPHIFDMFAQVDTALERSQGGLGIGLALARGLVEMHGGTIEAHSAGPDTGSKFTVRLPVLADGAGEAPVAPTQERGPAARRRILVVDDYEDAADTLAAILELMGHETCTARDGLEAMETAASFQPEVVLLDIGLPGRNGYEVARHIRGQPWGRTAVLVALTGWGQDDDKRRAEAAGFDIHLTKPVDPEVLQRLFAKMRPSGATDDERGRRPEREAG